MQDNVDILSFLEEVVQTNTRSYREDFQYDIAKFKKAVLAQDKESRTFLWMSRPCGTWCLNEHSIFIRESTESSIWTHYEHEADKIKAYRVVVTGEAEGRPVGNIYPVDYKSHVRHVKKNAVPAESVTLTFKSDQTVTFPYEQVKDHFGPIKDQYGTIIKIHYTAQDEHELEVIITAGRQRSEQRTRQAQHPLRRKAKQEARHVR